MTDSGWSVRSGLARLQASCLLPQLAISSSGKRTDVLQTGVHSHSVLGSSIHQIWLWAGSLILWALFLSIKLELYYLSVLLWGLINITLVNNLAEQSLFLLNSAPDLSFPWKVINSSRRITLGETDKISFWISQAWACWYRLAELPSPRHKQPCSWRCCGWSAE